MEGLLHMTAKSDLVRHLSRIYLDKGCGPKKSLGSLCFVNELCTWAKCVCVHNEGDWYFWALSGGCNWQPVQVDFGQWVFSFFAFSIFSDLKSVVNTYKPVRIRPVSFLDSSWRELKGCCSGLCLQLPKVLRSPPLPLNTALKLCFLVFGDQTAVGVPCLSLSTVQRINI